MNIEKISIGTYAYLTKLEQHLTIKKELLNLIEISQADRLTEKYDDCDISRCDWNYRFLHRNWVNFFFPILEDHLQKLARQIGYGYPKVSEIWFQQYDQNSTHGWHVHTNNWTSVYYLDLPLYAPRTQFKNYDFIEGEFNTKEGDIITFPSSLIHRAPRNTTKYRKTIISWNMDLEIFPTNENRNY